MKLDPLTVLFTLREIGEVRLSGEGQRSWAEYLHAIGEDNWSERAGASYARYLDLVARVDVSIVGAIDGDAGAGLVEKE